jgi:hypothetical protein
MNPQVSIYTMQLTEEHEALRFSIEIWENLPLQSEFIEDYHIKIIFKKGKIPDKGLEKVLGGILGRKVQVIQVD